jgi:signal transduction histidine kinase
MNRDKAAFMGKVAAGATHELKNVLAIIKESAGLIQDLIDLSRVEFPNKDRFIRSLGRINDQVVRGVDISTKLNTFAHTCDEVSAETDLSRAVSQAAFLAYRLARLKGISLEAIIDDRTISVRTDPLKLQMLIFSCVESLIKHMEPGGSIVLEVLGSASGKGISVRFNVRADQAPVPLSAGPSDLPDLTERAAELGMSLDVSDPERRISLIFEPTGKRTE